MAAIALCNGYILALGQLWGKDFGFPVNDVVMARVFSVDQHVLNIAMSVLAVLSAFFDHVTVSAFHIAQPPLAHAFGALATQIAHAIPTNAAVRTGATGMIAGVAFAGWIWIAKGAE